MRRQLKARAAADPLASVDWAEVGASLDERGYATTAALLATEQCRGLSALYDREEAFRSRVVMQRHGFGSGEYKYLRYPLPDIVEALRQAIYPQLAPIANRWRERLREEGRFPPALAAGDLPAAIAARTSRASTSRRRWRSAAEPARGGVGA